MTIDYKPNIGMCVFTADQMLLSAPAVGLSMAKYALLEKGEKSQGFKKFMCVFGGRVMEGLAVLSAVPALIYSIAKSILSTLAVVLTFGKVEAINDFWVKSSCMIPLTLIQLTTNPGKNLELAMKDFSRHCRDVFFTPKLSLRQ